MIINLISSPRNISTALMYSFAHRTDTKVMDEPFYAYYLNLTDAEHPGKDQIIKSQPTSVAGVKEWIQHTGSQHDVVFIKNMAHHLIQMDLDFLRDYVNVFLIRNPQDLILSFSKVIGNPEMKDIGLERQFEIYQRLSQHTSCPVIDSAEILKNPESALTNLCKEIGLKYEPSMIKWEAGAIPEDGVWAKYWYDSVHHSTGFHTSHRPKVDFPEHLHGLLRRSKTFYEELSKVSIKA